MIRGAGSELKKASSYCRRVPGSVSLRHKEAGDPRRTRNTDAHGNSSSHRIASRMNETPMQVIPRSRTAPLNRGSGIPLYHQIQQRLLDQIQSGELKPGTPMPSIERIAQRMGVSPMTVRQAIRALSDLGVLYSRQGKGTFISGIKLERDFRQVLSFTEEASAHGARPSSKVLSFEVQNANQKVRDALALSAGSDEVYTLRRVR